MKKDTATMKKDTARPLYPFNSLNQQNQFINLNQLSMKPNDKSTKSNPDLQTQNFGFDKNLSGIQKVSKNETEIEELRLCLDDIINISQAMQTLSVYIFGDPNMKHDKYHHFEFHREEATEIQNGLIAIRKFQRLLDLIKPIDDDPHEIGIIFKEIEA